MNRQVAIPLIILLLVISLRSTGVFLPSDNKVTIKIPPEKPIEYVRLKQVAPIPLPEPIPLIRPLPISLDLPMCIAGLLRMNEAVKGIIDAVKEKIVCDVSKTPLQTDVLQTVVVEDDAQIEGDVVVEEPIIIGRRMRLITFTADWCSGCKKMEPVWKELADEGFEVETADIDHPPHWMNNFRPAQIPLTVLFDDKDFQYQWVGGVSIKELRTALRYGEGVLPLSFGKVLESPQSFTLTQGAKESADLQAKRNKQGHHNWDHRRAMLVSTSGYLAIEEICAESWPEQKDADNEELWKEAFDSWRQSPGHWRIADNRWRAYGRARSQGSNGVWYFTILVGSNRFAAPESPAEKPETPEPFTISSKPQQESGSGVLFINTNT